MNLADAKRLTDCLNRIVVDHYGNEYGMDRAKALCRELNSSFPHLVFTTASQVNPSIRVGIGTGEERKLHPWS